MRTAAAVDGSKRATRSTPTGWAASAAPAPALPVSSAKLTGGGSKGFNSKVTLWVSPTRISSSSIFVPGTPTSCSWIFHSGIVRVDRPWILATRSLTATPASAAGLPGSTATTKATPRSHTRVSPV